jgi:hypothetical protein
LPFQSNERRSRRPTTRVASRRNDLRGIPRQPEQQISLQRQRGVFHRQIEQRQVMQLDHAPLRIGPRHCQC